jgi:hypothetical protein
MPVSPAGQQTVHPVRADVVVAHIWEMSPRREHVGCPRISGILLNLSRSGGMCSALGVAARAAVTGALRIVSSGPGTLSARTHIWKRLALGGL